MMWLHKLAPASHHPKTHPPPAPAPASPCRPAARPRCCTCAACQAPRSGGSAPWRSRCFTCAAARGGDAVRGAWGRGQGARLLSGVRAAPDRLPGGLCLARVRMPWPATNQVCPPWVMGANRSRVSPKHNNLHNRCRHQVLRSKPTACYRGAAPQQTHSAGKCWAKRTETNRRTQGFKEGRGAG